MGIHEAHLPLYVSLPDIGKYHVQDSNLILSTEVATHSCERLHHLTDGHGKMPCLGIEPKVCITPPYRNIPLYRGITDGS